MAAVRAGSVRVGGWVGLGRVGSVRVGSGPRVWCAPRVGFSLGRGPGRVGRAVSRSGTVRVGSGLEKPRKTAGRVAVSDRFWGGPGPRAA